MRGKEFFLHEEIGDMEPLILFQSPGVVLQEVPSDIPMIGLALFTVDTWRGSLVAGIDKGDSPS